MFLAVLCSLGVGCDKRRGTGPNVSLSLEGNRGVRGKGNYWEERTKVHSHAYIYLLDFVAFVSYLPYLCRISVYFICYLVVCISH